MTEFYLYNKPTRLHKLLRGRLAKLIFFTTVISYVTYNAEFFFCFFLDKNGLLDKRKKSLITLSYLTVLNYYLLLLLLLLNALFFM